MNDRELLEHRRRWLERKPLARAEQDALQVKRENDENDEDLLERRLAALDANPLSTEEREALTGGIEAAEEAIEFRLGESEEDSDIGLGLTEPRSEDDSGDLLIPSAPAPAPRKGTTDDLADFLSEGGNERSLEEQRDEALGRAEEAERLLRSARRERDEAQTALEHQPAPRPSPARRRSPALVAATMLLVSVVGLGVGRYTAPEGQQQVSDDEAVVAGLRTERDAARTEVASLRKERDEARAEVASLRKKLDTTIVRQPEVDGTKPIDKGGKIDKPKTIVTEASKEAKKLLDQAQEKATEAGDLEGEAKKPLLQEARKLLDEAISKDGTLADAWLLRAEIRKELAEDDWRKDLEEANRLNEATIKAKEKKE